MDEALAFARSFAKAAGDIMLKHFSPGIAHEAKPREGGTPVTIADKTINARLIAEVRELFPRHAVLGEEESFAVENPDYTWVCDPLDGTYAYVMGVPTNVFSLALVDTSGAPQIAAVYDPYLKRLYTASRGAGAFCNDTPLRVNGEQDLSKTIVCCSGSRSEILSIPSFKKELCERSLRMFAFNSCIYEAMLVALGQAGAVVYPGSAPHDAAAAKLIIEEAGGTVTDVFGAGQRYDQEIRGTIISNGALHNELLTLASRHLR